MKGIIVYDKADAEYNKWFIERIIDEAGKHGTYISLLLTKDIIGSDGEYNLDTLKEMTSDVSFALIRNRDYKLSGKLEKLGIRCFNSSYVCKIGNDKWEMYRDFQAAGIPVMYTQRSKLPYPFVYKPVNGHGGRDVYLVGNSEEYEKITEELENKKSTDDFIFQMPASEKGRDIRVYIIGENIVTAMERKASESSADFRANFSLGGSAVEHALTDDELRLAAKVANHIKADFVGIDIIYNNGKPVVNEVEDAVGTRMLYEYTNLDPVKIFLEHVLSVVS